MRTLHSVALLWIVLAAGCTSTSRAPVRGERPVSQDSGDGVPEFARAALGFDDPDSAQREGSRHLLRVELVDGDRSRTWWVLASVPDELARSDRSMSFTMTIDGVEETRGTRLTPVSLWVQEEGERDPRASVVELPLRALERGLFDLCQVYIARRTADHDGDSSADDAPELTRDEKRLYFACASSLVEMLRVIQGSKELSDVMWSVVQKPNVIALLLQGGDLSVSISPRFEEATAVEAELAPPLETFPACRFPMSVEVNESRALDCEITVCPAQAPLFMAGGIIRLVGLHPTRRERRVTIDLLGARGATVPLVTSE